MPFTVAQRVALSANERRWLPKLVLRLTVVLTSLIALGLLASILAAFGTRSAYDYGVFYFLDIYCLSAIGLALIWACISIPYLIIKKKAVHPGWHVGMDLTIWMAIGIAAGFAIAGGAVAVADSSYLDDEYDNYDCQNGSGGYYGNGGYSYNNNCRNNRPSAARENSLARIQLVGGVFLAIATLLEFALFVWACIDCQHHNTHKRDVEVSEMTTRVLADMRARGQLPTELPTEYPPMQQQQQHPLLHVQEPVMTPADASREPSSTMAAEDTNHNHQRLQIV